MFWSDKKVIEHLEFQDDSRQTLVYRFTRPNDEIKNGATLIVKQGQSALQIVDGQIEEVYFEGRHQIKTKSTTWFGSDTIKADIYFVNNMPQTDLKWGTKTPILYQDQQFGNVALRAFGTYGMKIYEPLSFIRQIVGTDNHFILSEISEQVRSKVIEKFTEVMGELKTPLIELIRNDADLSDFVFARIGSAFMEFGLEVVSFQIENISLPSNILQKIQRINEPDTENSAVPPPIPTNMTYFVALSENATPLSFNELIQKIQNKEVLPQTLIWKQNQVDWLAAETIVELKSYFV